MSLKSFAPTGSCIVKRRSRRPDSSTARRTISASLRPSASAFMAATTSLPTGIRATAARISSGSAGSRPDTRTDQRPYVRLVPRRIAECGRGPRVCRRTEGREAARKTAPVWDRESATVRDEIQWQEALDKAAIAKEKTERQFVEPKGKENEKPGAERNQTQPGSREEKVWPVNPPQHQSWPGFERAATEATLDDRTENLKGPAAQVWEAWQQSDSAQAFAAALDDNGIMFAAATGEEAYRSHRQADFARAVGNYAPRFKVGEIVIVTEPRPEYRRDGEIIEPPRVHKLDQSLAYKFVKGLDNLCCSGAGASNCSSSFKALAPA